jgi:hypothetical protein
MGSLSGHAFAKKHFCMSICAARSHNRFPGLDSSSEEFRHRRLIQEFGDRLEGGEMTFKEQFEIKIGRMPSPRDRSSQQAIGAECTCFFQKPQAGSTDNESS